MIYVQQTELDSRVSRQEKLCLRWRRVWGGRRRSLAGQGWLRCMQQQCADSLAEVLGVKVHKMLG